MKKIWPILLALWPYLGLALLGWTLSRKPLTGTPLLFWLAGLLVICIVNGFCALKCGTDAARLGFRLKAALIPFYVCGFLLGMMLVAAPPALISFFLLDGVLLLTTSAYTLRATWLCWREGALSRPIALVLAACQLIFVLDVIAAKTLEH